jgi:pimeloyl-ACP methyl ester carboxylesterase
MKRSTKIALWCVVAVIFVAGAAVGGGIWMVFKRPFTVDAWSTRRSLAESGLERQWATFSEGQVAVWKGGEGGTLMLLHGAGDQAGTWSSVVPDLVSHYSLLIPDLPGHRESDPKTGVLGVGTVLAGIEAVLEQHANGPITVVGNSLGGWIAMLLANNPQLAINRLVLVNGGAIKGETVVNFLPADREEAAALMAQTRSPKSPKIPGFVLDDLVRVAASGPIARIVITAEDMESYLLDGRLSEIEVPVDLLWGVDDQVMPLTYAQRLQDGLAAVRFTPLADCGHVPHRECPGAFSRELVRLLATPPPQPDAIPESTEETQ